MSCGQKMYLRSSKELSRAGGERTRDKGSEQPVHRAPTKRAVLTVASTATAGFLVDLRQNLSYILKLSFWLLGRE